MNITFIQLHESHFPLLLKWLEAPHVKRWWDSNIVYTLDTVKEKYRDYVKGYKQINKSKKPIQASIICLDNKPIGYLQIYNAYDFPRSKNLTELPESLGALDIFIGEEEYLGKSIGSQAITNFLNRHGSVYSHVFVDPDLKNISAIKAYEKAGFKKISEQEDSREAWMLWENKVISQINAPHFIWGDNCDGWWLKKAGNFTVIVETMPPGSSEFKHLHQITEQFFYVLDGILCLEINNHEYSLQKQQGISVPVGAIHQVFNRSKKPASFLVISCPNSHEDRVNIKNT